jgi:Secretion system C-terminal sorting domain
MKRLLLLLVILPICAWGQIITTFAGGGTALGDGSLAVLSNIGYPGTLVFDNIGNSYIIAPFTNEGKIRKINIFGLITTSIGTGIAGYSGDSGLAINAQINHPVGIAFDSIGNAFIADLYNARIRKIDAGTGIITTIAGTGSRTSSGDNGLAILASLIPEGICLDRLGNIYVADSAERIRKITPTGIITTIAGNGTPGFSGDNNLAINAELVLSYALCTDTANNLYIGCNGRIRKVDISTGIITTVAGNGGIVYNGDSITALNSQFYPYGIAIDNSSNLFIADYGNNRIRKIDAVNNTITTIAGTGVAGFSGDNSLAINAQINHPEGVTFDLCGNLYIADEVNKRIRKVWFNTDTIPQVISTITPNDTVVTGTQVTTTATANNHGTVTSYQWVKNGANASTNSAYTYTPVNGDSVYCIVTVRACTGRMYTDTTTAIRITVTGGAGVNSATNSIMQTYPNPVTDVLYVATTEVQSYTLYNVIGKAVMNGTADNHNSIDMRAMPTGMYLLQMTDNNGARVVQRIVKE